MDIVTSNYNSIEDVNVGDRVTVISNTDITNKPLDKHIGRSGIVIHTVNNNGGRAGVHLESHPAKIGYMFMPKNLFKLSL